MIFSIKPQIFELKCVFSYFRLKTHITLLLPVYVHSWEQRKLEDYLTVSAEKNTGNIYGRSDVLSVSGDYGIVNQIEFQGRSFAGASVSNYGVVQTGDVVYTKSPLNSNPYGIIKTNKGKPGIVSTLYAVYHPKENAFSDFIQVYFEQHARMNNYMHPLVNKGAKNDMKVSAENALKGPVCFPSRIEQESISAFFSVLDNLITLHQRKCQIDGCRFQSPLAITWEQRKVSELFKVTRGYVLAATLTEPAKTDEMPYPVYSSQTKDNGLMGYYKDYLYEDAITWTTDGANAGTVNYRAGKFYCTNVCGVLLSNEVTANQMIAEALNNVAKGYVSYVGNPKLMNNVMADIEIMIPTHAEEREKLSVFFRNLDTLITLHQCE